MTDSQDSKAELPPQAPFRGEKLVGGYLRNPVLRGLAQLVPFGIGGAIDTGAETQYENILRARQKVFFAELDRGDTDLSPELLRSNEFLHCFDITLRAITRTHRHEKIRMFARLLRSAASAERIADVDEYEELLRIIDELSLRELRVLMALEEYEKRYYVEGRFKDDEDHEGVFQRVAAEVFGVPVEQLPDEELRAAVVRINRTGCYGGTSWRRGPAKDCRLTPVYFRLKHLVQDESGRLA